MRRNKSGFTLIELLVVIAVISLLASIVLVALNNSRIKARDTRRIADLKQIGNALQLYNSDNGDFPGIFNTFYWISDNNYPGAGPWPPCSSTTGGLKPYIAGVCSVVDSDGNRYAYALTTTGGYKLGAKFELTANQGTQFVWGASNTAVAAYYELKQ